MSSTEQIEQAIALVRPGRWGVAVSGGADSVALLQSLHRRRDLELVVVHLDHETRAGQSTEDARFVAGMAAELGLPIVLATRSEVQPRMDLLPGNPQALYRAVRLELYRQAVAEHRLEGVLLAHHADDQAETVLMRLLRGAGIEGLSGIPKEAVIAGVRLVRPLLGVRREVLRQFLMERHIAWREDVSNASPTYQRNRVRQLLAAHPALVEPLLEVAERFGTLSRWLDERSPTMGEEPAVRAVRGLHPLVQLHALRRWLLGRGVAADGVSLALLERVRTMVEDSASPPGISAPGGVEIRRREGKLRTQHSQRGSSAHRPSESDHPGPSEATP